MNKINELQSIVDVMTDMIVNITTDRIEANKELEREKARVCMWNNIVSKLSLPSPALALAKHVRLCCIAGNVIVVSCDKSMIYGDLAKSILNTSLSSFFNTNLILHIISDDDRCVLETIILDNISA